MSIYEENDVLWGVDGFYSQGLQLSYLNTNNWGLRLGQQIYTPSNKDSGQPQYGDRPYAGYSSLTFFKDYYRDNNAIDSFEIGSGIVGPYSGGEWCQTEIHKLIKSAPPQGWKYQIYTEPIIQLAYYRTYSIFLNKYMEYRPLGGVNLGNALTDAELGTTVRAGYNIPKRFDPIIRVSASPFDEHKSIMDQMFGYGFIGVKGKLIARNIFLDGNTFRESIVTVDKVPLVADFYIGASIGLKYVELTYTHVERSQEFYTQTRANRFDSIQVTYNF